MHRPIVQAFWQYKDRIRKGINTFFADSDSIKAFTKARLTIRFRIAGHPHMDLDNLIKAVKDSITPLLIQDDDIKHISEYGPMKAELICNTCNTRSIKRDGKFSKDCGNIDSCPFADTKITMEEIK